MYTIRADRPLDPVILEILGSVGALAQERNYTYLLVGATARDMLMSHVFGIESRRATHDVDFAVALEDWDSFDLLRTALVESGGFAPAENRAHLLYYRPSEHGKAYPLDLIPFGGVEREPHQIAWPPDMSVVMNVTAYAEALESALEVDVGNGVIVREFDVTPAGAALLGYDAGVSLHEKSRQSLLAVLADPRKRDRLIVHMTRPAGAAPETAARLLDEFERGLHLKKL
jgi:predicted nucleotidyltransferase